jgi:hypothetical protein
MPWWNLCGISTVFPVLSPSVRQVAHALLTRPPLNAGQHSASLFPEILSVNRHPARLACVRHAASVHPEPGSNPQITSSCQGFLCGRLPSLNRVTTASGCSRRRSAIIARPPNTGQAHFRRKFDLFRALWISKQTYHIIWWRTHVFIHFHGFRQAAADFGDPCHAGGMMGYSRWIKYVDGCRFPWQLQGKCTLLHEQGTSLPGQGIPQHASFHKTARPARQMWICVNLHGNRL